MGLILASASPRRKELLSLYTNDFKIVISNVNEDIENGTPPEVAVKTIAKRKAEAVFKQYPDDIIIGADTIVVIDNKIFGKPADKQDAFEMLKTLSGKQHLVMTGVCVCSKNSKTQFVSTTKVVFNSLTDDEINWYISTNEPFDKAGAYGIQEKGALLIEKVEGDYNNVVGLPISQLAKVLKSLNHK